MKIFTMKLEAILARNLTDLMSKTSGLDTIDKVAIRSGVGRGTVDRVRKAEVSTKIETVEMLAAAFGVSPLRLLSEGELSFASNDPAPARPTHTMQWVNASEETLLNAYRTTDEDGRRTMDNIASLVPKTSFAAFGTDKVE